MKADPNDEEIVNQHRSTIWRQKQKEKGLVEVRILAPKPVHEEIKTAARKIIAKYRGG